jgi:pyridoxal phosphate enzyme (YggS family)
MPSPTTIADNLDLIRQRIADCARQHGRPPESVRLLAVSKSQPAEALREAYAAGQADFGENYLQEALAKIQALQGLAISWHFIGAIQSNKTRDIASHFAWVHSIDRLKIAQRLSEQRPAHLPPLNVCIQINVSDEASKSGIHLEDVIELAHAVAQLPGLKLRGLMALPQPSEDYAEQRRNFAPLREVMQQLQQQGLMLDTLSMGMSGDMDAAIAEGSTLVRIGTAIFGERIKKT